MCLKMLYNPKAKCTIILKSNHYSKLGHIDIIIAILMHSLILVLTLDTVFYY